jgi:hypothetical protein
LKESLSEVAPKFYDCEFYFLSIDGEPPAFFISIPSIADLLISMLIFYSSIYKSDYLRLSLPTYGPAPVALPYFCFINGF